VLVGVLDRQIGLLVQPEIVGREMNDSRHAALVALLLTTLLGRSALVKNSRGN
jgi:hypothetical protein